MKIAFIGTGTMGGPMLANLVKKGFAVTAFDIVTAALQGAVKAGATAAASTADAARGADLVVTMLPSSSHVESVYLGKGGVLDGVAAGKLCVDMSTIDPAVSSPDDVFVIVAGGPGKHSAVIPNCAFSRAVSVAIAN